MRHVEVEDDSIITRFTFVFHDMNSELRVSVRVYVCVTK